MDFEKIELKEQIYPLQSVYSVCYTFLDKAYFRLDKDNKGNILVYIKGKDDKKTKQIIDDFHNELISYGNYMNNFNSNKDAIKMIVEKALFASNPSLIEEAEQKEIDDLLKEIDDEEDDELKSILKEIDNENKKSKQSKNKNK